ncbi:acetyl-CoA carboxylase biotin carboxylase subunit [Shimia sp.]|uniref:acetyl-CoA carboxylase biotin carboxylase subunit n=1 Tax=Shimia sp. TaxID=1954381 RepID=UPI003298E59B
MPAIKRILIANRGEIAVRVIRTCRALGIETVLAVSEADRDGLGARLATRSVCIGPSRSTDSYLKVGTIIEAALGTQCDAIHPGYGFLSENQALAAACDENDIIFIGPDAVQIEAVGDKLTARQHAIDAKVPLVPGGNVSTPQQAAALASEIGFPLLIKAVSGGGGRGMKRVDRVEGIESMYDLAVSEATAAFGDGRVYMERLVTVGRHVEVQILSDGKTILHVGERDCSVQRRYQKVVEEAPAPCLPTKMRDDILEAALRFSRHIGYRSLGTVEFLVDCERDEFYFLEMNARIQVEHPVTEAISGMDLVAAQIAIAEGQPLTLTQSDIQLKGHSFECRVNAEDISADFRPSPGQVGDVWFPSATGLRVDTHIQSGAMISPHYDSMIAKVITWGETRDIALQRMRDILSICVLDGVKTNIPLHRVILDDDDFIKGGVDTNYLGQLLEKVPANTMTGIGG